MIGFHLEAIMNFTKPVLIAMAISFVTACTSNADTTAPTTIDGLKGRTLRVAHPGEIITMDCRLDRVTVTIDENNKITSVNFC
jgi:hypothetical protein